MAKAKNALRMMRIGAELGGKIMTLLFRAFADVAEAMQDGQISADEAGDLVSAQDYGNLKVKIKGTDIVDDETQELIEEAVGRIARNAVQALIDSVI